MSREGMEQLVFWIIGGVGLLHALTFMRDFAIREGWITETSWWPLGAIARNAIAMQRRHVSVVLDEIRYAETKAGADRDLIGTALRELGLTPLLRTEIRRAADSATQPWLREHAARPLSHRLLINLKERAKKLQPPFYYRKGPYYLDSMGASSYVPEREAELAHLLVEWVSRLEHEGVIGPFDAVLAVKDGNVSLALQFCHYTGKPMIMCKGRGDHARVERPAGGRHPHETDFEGLEALEKAHAAHQGANEALSVIAIDDNCRGGSSLTDAMLGFNELAAQKQYPFRPVKHAIVLFTVKDPKTRDNFLNNGLDLHCLISLGESEIKRLTEADTPAAMDQLLASVVSFKRDYGADWSLRLSC